MADGQEQTEHCGSADHRAMVMMSGERGEIVCTHCGFVGDAELTVGGAGVCPRCGYYASTLKKWAARS